MRVLITGGAGLVGSTLVATAPRWADVEVTVLNRPAPVGHVAHHVDLADPGAFVDVIGAAQPDLVIHTAYRLANGDHNIVVATEEVARACGSTGVDLIQLSTDAVFDGEHGPFDEASVPTPIHEYGRQKFLAEECVAKFVDQAAIVRTSLITRFDPPDRAVCGWMIDAGARGEPVTLFDDEIRMPIRLDDLVDALWHLVALAPAARSGYWHLVGPEALTRAEIGDIVVERFGLDRSLVRTASSATFDGPPRPRDLRLVDTRSAAAFGFAPRSIRTA